MKITINKKQQDYITNLIKSGEYQNKSEVVRDAVRLHRIHRETLIKNLRKEIKKGWEGPDSEKTIKAIIASKKKS
ncbi:type II toxin-antitoxin system ParD family antitoxin [Maribacter aurantiacus]|uniref:Type II toxin-antitoxin system ParD family antitoxin n=1 Tax=Maribacter aurantiacus TaxID=1882343 RepID=A0A5R8M4R2_9FLAO|nr:type II toxin-antitoxin system ParD family antitoxin [Maribacter aurantiacus]TLF44577.1 type II toxin-antitoxin system ParD family antitoxin [Maribacter aurantiacus]